MGAVKTWEYTSKQPVQISPALSPMTVGGDDLCALHWRGVPTGVSSCQSTGFNKRRLPEHKNILEPA